MDDSEYVQRKMMELQRKRIASGAGSKSSGKKSSGGYGTKKGARHNPWLKFFAEYRKSHRGKYEARVMMQKAAAAWRRLPEKQKRKYSDKKIKITGGKLKHHKKSKGGSKTKPKIKRSKGGCGPCPNCGY